MCEKKTDVHVASRRDRYIIKQRESKRDSRCVKEEDKNVVHWTEGTAYTITT